MLLVRFNLRGAALLLLASVLFVLHCGWEGQVLGALASAVLATLADRAEQVFGRLDAAFAALGADPPPS